MLTLPLGPAEMRDRRLRVFGKRLRRARKARLSTRIARELRKNPTEAEAALWARLRRRQVGKFKFRRHAPVLGFIVDFYCPACRLIVECDGPADPESAAARDQFIMERGFSVVRFTPAQVLENSAACIEELTRRLQSRGFDPFQQHERMPRQRSLSTQTDPS